MCLPSKAKPDVSTQNFHLTNANLKKLILKYKQLKLPKLIPKENDIT